MSNIKLNTLTSYISQGYAAIIGIIIMPFLFSILGSDAFGLIGFFSVLQIVINLFGSGFTPTIAREIARTSNKYQNKYLISITRTFETIFQVLLCAIILFAYFYSPWFSESWFNSEIPSLVLTDIVFMIFIICALRFQSVLYLSVLRGYEDFTWLNTTAIIFNTFRYPISLLIAYYYPDIVLYFYWQLVISTFELIFLRVRIGKLLGFSSWLPGYFNLSNIKALKNFAQAVAITAIISVTITQTDKIIMSNVLSLSDYGYFTICMMLSNGILMLGYPIGTVLIPRLTSLYSDGKLTEFSNLYIKFTQFICIFIIPGAIVIAGFSSNVVFLFTNSEEAALWGGSVLNYYALGNAFLIVGGFQYYQQVAKGELKYHVRYSIALLVTSLPLIIIFGYQYGAIAVAIIWFSFRLFSFVFWVPYIHKKLKTVKYIPWLCQGILPSASICSVSYAIIKLNDGVLINDKLLLLIVLISTYLAIVACCLISYKLSKKLT